MYECSYPNLMGLVVGAFGEGSDDLHQLVGHFATSRERFVSQSSGYALSEGERSQIIGQIRRRLSTTFMRAITLCTISRMAHVGPTAKAAATRREVCMRQERAMRLERQAYWQAYMEGGGRLQGGIHHFPG